MPTKIEKVSPQIVNGIEFYLSNTSDQCAMSQTGLAKLAGVPETTVRRHLSDRQKQGKIDYFDDSNPDVAEGRAIAMISNNQAKLIADYACVEYLEFQAAKGNKTAQYSLKKFSLKGFRGWVREIVGSVTEGDTNKLQSTMEQLVGMVGELSAKFDRLEAETATYRKVVVQRQGLKEWIELEETLAEIADSGQLDTLWTLSEYLWEQKQMKFNKAQMSLFSNKVSYVFRAMQKEPPGRKQGRRENGQLAPETNAYRSVDFPLLDLAYKQTVIEF